MATAAISAPSTMARRLAHTDSVDTTLKIPKLNIPGNYIQNFLTQDGFQTAWTEYQTLMARRLSEMIAGTGMEQDDPKTILLKTAREPGYASIFNHASMLHNNHFFFSGISSGGAALNPSLQNEIEFNFGSLDNLRREMLYTALGMFGPGFVWLVRVVDKRLGERSPQEETRMHLRVLPTYLAGSPYAEAHWRRQAVDMNTEGEATFRQGPIAGLGMGSYQKPWTPGSDSGVEQKTKLPPGGANVVPLLCLNTWEHVWLTDYGIGDGTTGGKREYALRWWRVIDWGRVRELALGARHS